MTRRFFGFQPVNALLSALAALDGTDGDKGVLLTAASTATTYTLTAFGRSLAAAASAAAARGLIDAQQLDATLTALAALGTGADKGIYFTGADTAAEYTLTSFGRSLVAAANAAAARGVLDAQQLDATLTALAALAWSAGSQVPVFTAADTVGLSTVGTAANNLVALDGSARLPAVNGSLLTNLPSSGTWDWAAAYATLSAGDWANATTYGSTGAAVSFGLVESDRALRIVIPQGAEDKGGGMFRSIGAGDFRVGARLQLGFTGADLLASTFRYCWHMLAFVDGTDLAPGGSNWYGAGLKYNNDSTDTADVVTMEGTDFDTQTQLLSTYGGVDTVDVVLQRSGTTLTVYVSRGGGAPRQADSWTVSAGAGLVGFRCNTVDAAPNQWYGLVLAYAHALSAVPGQS